MFDKEDFASSMIGYQLLKEDPHDLLKTVADGFSLVQRARKFQRSLNRDFDAGNIFTTYQYIADLLTCGQVFEKTGRT